MALMMWMNIKAMIVKNLLCGSYLMMIYKRCLLLCVGWNRRVREVNRRKYDNACG
jgi:hypothetical protein